jgi:hypothetical protein
VIQLDKSEAKVFVENNIYSKIESEFMRKERTPQDVCDMISKNPKSLGDELQYFASILKELSKSNIKIVELTAKSKNKLLEKVELLVEQNYIADQWMRSTGRPKEAVLKEILDTVKSAQKINGAFARYCIDARVKEALVVEEAELPERKVRKEAEKKEKLAAIEEPETYELKTARANFRKLLDEWVEKGVPKKEELLKCAESTGMTQKEFEEVVESTVREMKDSNEGFRRSTESFEKKLQDLAYSSAQSDLEMYIRENESSIMKNEERIKKAEEALRILRGA